MKLKLKNSVGVKSLTFGIVFVTILIGGMPSLNAQDSESSEIATLIDEEEGPLMFKFEPNFLSAIELRREDIKRKRAIIDTLNITDRKRRRLLRELYKDGVSERLEKAMVAETKFVDDSEEDIEK